MKPTQYLIAQLQHYLQASQTSCIYENPYQKHSIASAVLTMAAEKMQES